MRIAALEGGAARHPRQRRQPRRDLRGLEALVGRAPPRARRGARDPVDEVEAFYASRSLLGRAVTGADVAEAVAFLVSDRSRATTGAVIPVDGGVPAAFPR